MPSSRLPSIAPSGLVIYDSDMFADWKGSAIIGGLVSRALIHVDLKGDIAKESERFKWGKRIREVEQGPEGALRARRQIRWSSSKIDTKPLKKPLRRAEAKP
jgi:glucose/arabinose dehydrogenase